MAEETKNYMLEDEETSGFDYKAFFIKLLIYWPWIVGSIAVFLIGAFFYLKTLTPLYTVSSSVLIKNESKGGANGANLEDWVLYPLPPRALTTNWKSCDHAP